MRGIVVSSTKVRHPGGGRELKGLRVALRLAACCAIGLGLVAFESVTTDALTDGAAAYAGSGTTAPGLSMTPTAQQVGGGGTLAGVATVGGNLAPVDDTCGFSGSTDIQSTLVQSDGNLSVSCTGPAQVSSSLHYARTGPVVELQGLGSINGSSVVVNGVCNFVPASGPVVTTYELGCAVVGSDSV